MCQMHFLSHKSSAMSVFRYSKSVSVDIHVCQHTFSQHSVLIVTLVHFSVEQCAADSRIWLVYLHARNLHTRETKQVSILLNMLLGVKNTPQGERVQQNGFCPSLTLPTSRHPRNGDSFVTTMGGFHPLVFMSVISLAFKHLEPNQ